MSMHVRAFLPTSEKARQAEFHPVQPWIAVATKDDHVCVWDWHSQQASCFATISLPEYQILDNWIWNNMI